MHEQPQRAGKQEDVQCAECDRQTIHTVMVSYKTSWHDDEHDISGGNTHEFLRCNGCANGTYRVVSWFSEEEGSTTRMYPPRGGYKRKPESWMELPCESNIPRVYDQTITAFNAGLFTLAGAGVRLLIEGVCIDRKITDGPRLDGAGKPVVSKKNGTQVRLDNLEGRINGLAEQGFISQNQATHLHQIRFLGNDAAHQLDIPTAKVVGHAIDIAEHLLDQLYEQPAKAQALAARKRPGKQ